MLNTHAADRQNDNISSFPLSKRSDVGGLPPDMSLLHLWLAGCNEGLPIGIRYSLLQHGPTSYLHLGNYLHFH